MVDMKLNQIELPGCVSKYAMVEDEERRRVLNSLRMNLLSDSLKVSKDITPKLHTVIKNVVDTIGESGRRVECFVQNNPVIDAKCFSVDPEILTISISSGLVNLLDDEELAFVIGHELGHFLLGHLNFDLKLSNSDDSSFFRMKELREKQSFEISADRVGLLCCNSIDVALKTIVKTVSGLSSSHITENFQSFLHQIKSLDYRFLASQETTHPIFPVRARALLLFSMSDVFYQFHNLKNKAPLDIKDVNNKVIKDLRATTQKYFYEIYQELLLKFKIWFCAKVFIQNNSIDEETLRSLKLILGKSDTSRVASVVQNNMLNIDEKYQFYRNSIAEIPADILEAFFKDFEKDLSSIVDSNHLALTSLNKLRKKYHS